MNANLHRIVWNAARNMRMVVQETARSAGKAPGTTTGGAAVVAAAMLTLTPAQAQIVADPGAPGHRATVLATPNGLPLVNIVTPNAAGVSHNIYRQFDVGASGAVINNSRTTVQSNIGGIVGGNPWLAKGPARVILNEVNSSAPSYLRGPVEVAGSRAELIIANPSGIQVQGGGFINVSRATLTTGVPQLNAFGGIDSYRVTGGTIGVSGKGLDASGTEFAALYARMVSINGGVWGGGEVRVVTGANEVGADGTPGVAAKVTPVAGTGPTPALAFDAGALGGMYAQKIWIMGTEAGVGARNAGTIQTGAGDARLMGLGELTVTASGHIENIGTIQAAGNANIAGPTFANSGSVLSAGATRVAAQGDLLNSGTLEGQRIELASAAGDVINARGTIRQTGTAGLTLAAPTLANTNGGTIGHEPVAESPGSGGGSSPGESAPATGSGTGSASGGAAAPGASNGPSTLPPAPVSPGTITAAGAIRNDGGHVYAGGPIALQTPNVSNAGGTLEVASMAASGASFSNAGGTLNVSQGFQANVGNFDNSAGGKLHAGSVNITITGDLNNLDGTIESDGDVILDVAGMANNQRGSISAAGALNANVGEAIQNSSGILTANQAVSITARSLDSTLGAISSAAGGTSLGIANALFNSGNIAAATDLSVRTATLINSGSLRAGNDTTVTVAGALTNDGNVTAGRLATITADSLQGGATGVLGAGINADGSLATVGALDVTTTQALAAYGTNLAAGSATLKGASVDLSGSQTSAANIAITATQGDVTTGKATVATPGTLSITADALPTRTLMNDGGVLNAGAIDLHASNIVNTNGAEIVQTGTGSTAVAVTGSLNNAGGRIASNGQDLTLQAAAFANTHGSIEHAGIGTLSVMGGRFDGAGGIVVSNGALSVGLSGAFNQDGASASAKQITIDAGSLSNRGGTIVQTGTDATRIAVVGAVDNSSAGTIASNGGTTIAAGSLNNQAGSIQAAGTADLSVSTNALLDNSAQGEIGAGGNVTVNAGNLVNDTGRITAVDDLAATVVGAASNVGGTLAANGSVAITAGSLDSTGGTVAAVRGDLRITTVGATVNAGGTMQAGGNVALASGGLDNTAGKVVGNALSIDTRGNSLANAQGTLAAATTVAVNSGALVNDAGLIQSGSAMTVNTNGQALSNTNAAGYTGGRADGQSSQGGITSADTLDLATGSVDNAAGYIGAANALTAGTQAFSNIGGGVVFGQSSVVIDTHDATYDNTGGQTLVVGDLTVRAGAIGNAGGLIRAAATTTLDADTIVNKNTQGKDQGIEGRNVALTVGDLDNSAGAIRSDVDLAIISGGRIDNTSGLISSRDTLRIADPNAANPTAKTLAIINTHGTLMADRRLQLDAARFSADGTMVSGKDLRVALTQDIVNNGEVSANGDLSYTTTGTLTNNGKLLAGGTLTAGGSTVENTADGEMTGTDTLIRAGTLNNRGLIDSHGQTRIDAGTVNNIGTGRIYGDAVAVGAVTLNNDAETVNGATSAATIAARASLDIGAQTVNNRDDALIFSAGDMFIGGALDGNGFATGQGSVLNNLSASIESLGDMSISMATVNNLDTHLTVVQGSKVENFNYPAAIADQKIRDYADTRVDPITGQIWHVEADGSLTLIGIGYGDWHVTTTTIGDIATNLAPARLVAGGNLNIDGHLVNRDSKVTAGKTLTAPGADNSSTPGTVTKTYSGYVNAFDGSGNGSVIPIVPFSDPTKTGPLGNVIFEGNTDATSGFDPGSAPGVNAPAGTAGSAGGVSGGGGAGTVIEVASAVQGSAPASGNAAGTAGAADAGGTAPGAGDTPMVVRTSTPKLDLPSASLFRNQPGAGSNYLIETDPRFANYRNWLSSDYLLNNLGLDPNTTLKRFGDGFYEQQLIREQVAQLTGYRFIDGFSSDEAQYAALMNAGVTFAQKFNLTPGIALSAEQMAQLTSDIVWLVEQTVTLPDGSTQRVLVPQVYVRVQPGDIDGSGALLSGDRVVIKGAPGSGDMTNSGTIGGRTLVSITADNINNLGGRISGGSVGLEAANDINNIGATIDAKNSMSLVAGHDINVVTTTSSAKGSMSSATSVDRIAGLYVTNPGGVLVASAGNDVNVVAGIVANTGADSRTLLNAGHDINLGTVVESSHSANIVDSGNYRSQASSHEVGSQITGGGSVTLKAGNDINATAANVAAQGVLDVVAGNDINILAGRSGTSGSVATQSKKKGILSRTTTTLQGEYESETSVSSTFSGDTVKLDGGRDVNIVGSDVTSQAGTTINAGRNVNIVSSVDTASASASSSRTTTGLMGGKGTLDTRRNSQNTLENSSSTQHASNVASASGDTRITAGGQVNVYASNLSAGQDLNVTGAEVTILSGLDDTRNSMGTSNSRNGLTVVPHRAGKGIAAKSNETNGISETTLAASTLSGQNVNITATQGDVTLGAAHINASDGVTLNASNGAINFDIVNTATVLGQSRGESDLLYQRTRDNGSHVEEANYTQIHGGTLEMNAPKVNVQVGQNAIKAPGEGAYIAQQTLAQALGQQLTQPGMGWLGQIQNDPELKDVQVNWQGVPVEQRQWAEAQGGLTQTGAAVVAIAAAVLTWGAASAAGGAVATSAGQGVALSAASGGGYFLTGTGMVMSATVAAGVSSIAAQAAVGLINHNGNVGAVLEDLASSRGVKTTLAAMVTAGTGTYFVNDYGAAGLGVKVAGGCAAGALSGTGCQEGALTAGEFGAAGWGYNSLIGYDAYAGPGNNPANPIYVPDPSTGRQPWFSMGNNVIGNNEVGHLCSQGTACSMALNIIPFVNSTAGAHDYLFNANPQLSFDYLNVPTMLPAAAFGIAASLNDPAVAWWVNYISTINRGENNGK